MKNLLPHPLNHGHDYRYTLSYSNQDFSNSFMPLFTIGIFAAVIQRHAVMPPCRGGLCQQTANCLCLTRLARGSFVGELLHGHARHD